MTRLRGWLPWTLIAAGLLVAVLVAGAPDRGRGRELDPTSASPGGTRALVDTLDDLGVDVAVDDRPPDPRTTAVLVLVDGLRSGRRDALTRWMEAGGTLVVADRSSPLNPFRSQRPTLLGLVDRDLPRHCEVPALADAAHVRVPSATLLRPRPPAVGCFSTGAGAWLVLQQRGRGNLVALGGAQPFTNESLGDADNGLLAVTLLAPRQGAHVLVQPLPGPGRGRRTLIDLVSPNVTLALLQLVAAFLVLAWWRARRLGRPVIERRLVQIPGSELVAAVGRLFQRARARDRAAAILRDGARRSLAHRLGLAPDAPVGDVADAVARRTGRERDDLERVLGGPAPGSDGELVLVAHDAEVVGREVTSAG